MGGCLWKEGFKPSAHWYWEAEIGDLEPSIGEPDLKGGTSDPSLYHENVISLSLFYRYYFGNCSFELSELVPLPFSWGMSTCYSDRSHDISVTIPRCDKDVYVNSFFPNTAKFSGMLFFDSGILWNAFLWPMI